MTDACWTSSVTLAIDRFLHVVGLNFKPATVENYRKCLRPLRDLTKPIEHITIDDLRQVYATLRDRKTRWVDHPRKPAAPGGLSVWTLRKYVVAWKTFFNWLIEEGVIGASPAAKLKRPQPPKTPPKDMTPEDLERMLKAAHGENARDYAIICLLADSACRVGGLATLTTDRLDIAGHSAIVFEKFSKARPIHFKDRTELALMRYLEDERGAQAERLSRLDKPVGNYLFLGTKGPLTTAGVYRVMARTAKKAKVVGRYNPHSLRHAWARQAIKRGASLKEVQEILGHESIVTTATFYAVFLDSETAEIHQKLSWLPDEPKSEGATK